MAVRDPAFWRRFSVAVHLSEQKEQEAAALETSKNRPDLKHTESWLERQQHKKSRRTCMCWFFWLCLIAIVTGVVIAILYLKARDII